MNERWMKILDIQIEIEIDIRISVNGCSQQLVTNEFKDHLEKSADNRVGKWCHSAIKQHRTQKKNTT